ncbi:EamA family transporter [Cloacibacillus porcorum]|uniref:EamA family transporter n=1 Tax=Cloacibacillus porcorum TaxID=1197717 RepID=UPI00248E5B66|nr:EamA family transporter [Cloacibacillus porcorum]
MPLWGFLLSFLAAAMWAASPIMVNYGLAISKCSIHEVNPFRAAVFFVTSLIIALIYNGGHITPITSPLIYFYLFAGVSAGYLLGDLFYFIAIREIGVSLAVPIANGYPILVIFTSWILLGEPVTMKLLWGVVVVVSGILLLRFGGEKIKEPDDAADALHNKRRLMKGFAFAIATGCFWALSAPMTKLVIITSGLGPVEVTFYRSFAFLVISIVARIVTVKYRSAATIPRRRSRCGASGLPRPCISRRRPSSASASAPSSTRPVLS